MQLRHVGSPFFRVETSRAADKGGTELGLLSRAHLSSAGGVKDCGQEELNRAVEGAFHLLCGMPCSS